MFSVLLEQICLCKNIGMNENLNVCLLFAEEIGHRFLLESKYDEMASRCGTLKYSGSFFLYCWT